MAGLQTIIYQIVLSIMRESQFSSASPGHINEFLGVTGANTSIGTDEELREAIAEIMEEIGVGGGKEETEADLASDLLNVEGKKGAKEGTTEKEAAGFIRKKMSIIQNPNDIAMEIARFMPHAALVLIAASIAPLIFDIMTKPGGPLDLRFKRIIADEINAYLLRQTQKDTEMGVRQVIIQSKRGFTAINGQNNYNTLRGIREGGIVKERLDRIGMKDHSKGVFDLG